MPKNRLAELLAACGKEEVLKARFMADHRSVLNEHGPDGYDPAERVVPADRTDDHHDVA